MGLTKLAAIDANSVAKIVPSKEFNLLLSATSVPIALRSQIAEHLAKVCKELKLLKLHTSSNNDSTPVPVLHELDEVEIQDRLDRGNAGISGGYPIPVTFITRSRANDNTDGNLSEGVVIVIEKVCKITTREGVVVSYKHVIQNPNLHGHWFRVYKAEEDYDQKSPCYFVNVQMSGSTAIMYTSSSSSSPPMLPRALAVQPTPTATVSTDSSTRAKNKRRKVEDEVTPSSLLELEQVSPNQVKLGGGLTLYFDLTMKSPLRNRNLLARWQICGTSDVGTSKVMIGEDKCQLGLKIPSPHQPCKVEVWIEKDGQSSNKQTIEFLNSECKLPKVVACAEVRP